MTDLIAVQRIAGWEKLKALVLDSVSSPIAKNHAEPGQTVRGIIVAREISEDLVLACFGVPGVELFEYEMSVTVKKVAA